MTELNRASTTSGGWRRNLYRYLWIPVVGSIVLSASAFFCVKPAARAIASSPETPRKVHALARIEPKSRVIRLSSPTVMEGSRISELKVREGDELTVGQIVAVLDTHERRRGALLEAEARVGVHRAKLLQIQAGAKPGEIAAQQSAVNRCRFILRNTETELERSRKLLESKTISASEFEQRKLQADQARQDLERAEATLESIREIRQVDVNLQMQEIESAKASVDKAAAELDATLVKSPIEGRVLRIHTRPGERVGNSGVMEIGQIDVMYAVAEVYEADVARVRNGQSAQARLSGSSLIVRGTVEEIGLIVARKDVLNNDPVSDTDARVVEVRVRLDDADGARVAGFSNARCEITFED